MAAIKEAENLADAHDFQSQSSPLRPIPPFHAQRRVDEVGQDEQLPLYTGKKIEKNSEFQGSIEQLANTLRGKDGENLPITAYPAPTNNPESDEDEIIQLKKRVIDMYFDAISKADVDVLSALLTANLVTAETTNQAKNTPLLAAVEAGKAASVRRLLDANADVNAYGIIVNPCPGENQKTTHRTPLQHAAQLGNLALVKLLLENGADDALIAPDGQLALRLAANHGHREIVDLLPKRRGGGFKRWQAKHETAMKRCRKAGRRLYRVGKFFAWEVPRFVVWTVPKEVIVLPIWKQVKWLIAHWKEIPGLVLGMFVELWQALKKAPGAALNGIKALPEVLAKVGKGIWVGLKLAVELIVRFVKRIPNAVKIALVGIWSGVKKAGGAVGKVLASIVSFVHTVGVAVAGFFQRITLRDVLRSFVTGLRAIFLDGPKMIWGWLCSFIKVSGKVLKAMFGCVGTCIAFMFMCVWEAIIYTPRKLGEMLAACGSSLRSGGKEILVWVDPKRT